jgi:hypothetical protein
MSKIDDVFRKALSDSDIFESRYDNRSREKFPRLFEEKDWKTLEELFEVKDEVSFKQKIDERIQEIGHNPKYREWKRELTKQAERIKKAYTEKPYLLGELLKSLSWYGAMECNLPTMDDYGKIIERYEPAIVEEFFMDKISKQRRKEGKALAKVLEYVKELYDSEVSVEEIAYFVRKLDSLGGYWEVIA